jgi:hypothetical protein
MQLLEPGVTRAETAATPLGRIATQADPAVEVAVDAALAAAGSEVIVIDPAEIEALGNAFITLYFAELWDADHHLAETEHDSLSTEVLENLPPIGAPNGEDLLVTTGHTLDPVAP